MNDSKDWARVGFSENTVPNSCCKEVPEGNTCDSNSVHVYANGCMASLQKAIENNALILGGVGIGIAIIQVTFESFTGSLHLELSGPRNERSPDLLLNLF